MYRVGSLEFNNIGDESAVVLGKALKVNTVLQALK